MTRRSRGIGGHPLELARQRARSVVCINPFSTRRRPPQFRIGARTARRRHLPQSGSAGTGVTPRQLPRGLNDVQRPDQRAQTLDTPKTFPPGPACTTALPLHVAERSSDNLASSPKLPTIYAAKGASAHPPESTGPKNRQRHAPARSGYHEEFPLQPPSRATAGAAEPADSL